MRGTLCTHYASVAEEGERGGTESAGRGGGTRTNEIGVIRFKLLVQFDRVRFVYGVPKCHPVGDDGVDVFWRCIPGRRKTASLREVSPHTDPRVHASVSKKKKNTELWKSGRTHAAPARIGPQASLHILLKGAGQTSESANSLQVDQKQKVRRMMKKIGG